MHHLVGGRNDPQRESLYQDLALGFYKADVANLSCKLRSDVERRS